ncbi:MAG: hypothetical protein JXR15_16025 [Shimia sp.]|uniref:carbonic anhydrase n=1 Tax=Shimia sp. TaxID=1954381 RepID=UPI003B8D005C
MSNTVTLLDRNANFAARFSDGDMPVFPKLNTMIIACIDARVDPAHVLGLDLGDAVVIRNTGGRVTPAVIEEISALSVLINQINGGKDTPFEVVLLQHTQCGAERYADPNLRAAIQSQAGIDVTPLAIHDHDQSLKDDLETLREAKAVPNYLVVSAMLYDVKTGGVSEIVAPAPLG